MPKKSLQDTKKMPKKSLQDTKKMPKRILYSHKFGIKNHYFLLFQEKQTMALNNVYIFVPGVGEVKLSKSYTKVTAGGVQQFYRLPRELKIMESTSTVTPPTSRFEEDSEEFPYETAPAPVIASDDDDELEVEVQPTLRLRDGPAPCRGRKRLPEHMKVKNNVWNQKRRRHSRTSNNAHQVNGEDDEVVEVKECRLCMDMVDVYELIPCHMCVWTMCRPCYTRYYTSSRTKCPHCSK